MVIGRLNRVFSMCFRICIRTESFIVEGVSVEQDLVPFITSDIGVYGEWVNSLYIREPDNSMNVTSCPHYIFMS